jgi:hypothetical protein
MILSLKRLTVICSTRNFSSMAKNMIGLCQMRSTNDKNENRKMVQELFEKSHGKANFLFFPECCDYVGKGKGSFTVKFI